MLKRTVLYLNGMKRISLLFLLLAFAACASYAATEAKYGALNVFSKVPNSNIFVDGEKKGTASAQIKDIQAGTHFIIVSTGEAGTEIVSYSDVVQVNAGEVTTIYIDEHGTINAPKKEETQQKEVDVFRVKRIIDYSKEMHTGWYLKLSYLSNLYYNIDSPTLDHLASTFDLGLGFKIPIAPSIDFSLEMERGQLTSSNSTWYFMPITANIQLSFLPSQYFSGKQYYGLGIGYYMTDLENDLKQNLTTMGYHLFYGLELPASDESAFFFEFGYHSADIARYDYVLNTTYASAGYRWDVFK